MDELVKYIKEQMSDNCEKKIEKLIKYLMKLDKKQKSNQFVEYRDTMVIATVMLATAFDSIDSIQTTKSGREHLQEIKNEIINHISNLNEIEGE